jgi:hypothetical protein
MKSQKTRIKEFTQAFRDALLKHGVAARFAEYRTVVVWEDGAGRFNTATFLVYAVEPFLIRLAWNVYSVLVRGRLRDPEGERSEITLLPSELPRLADEIAQRTAKGELLRPYLFTPAAWQINPHHAPGVDRQYGSLPPWCRPDRGDSATKIDASRS